MEQTVTSQPIVKSEHDLLDRSNIVIAISKKILERSSSNTYCEVIGVYGKWGEGKSSVLNLVKERVEEYNNKSIKEHYKIKSIDFNPWLFQDHESMLLDFFKILQTGFTGDELKEKLKQYGPLVALGTKGLLNLALPMFSGVTNNIIDTVVDVISDSKINIKSLKTEIDEQIKLSKTHYVIFIDDVDRLDQEELHTLFKLIKQNADFVNTTYVVSMDADMVASSIGHRFEDGSKDAGRNFLEKIVQYPVHLPKVQRSKIVNVFEEVVISEFEELYFDGVSINMQPKEELISDLIEYVLPLFDTVREMMIFGNTISFTLPFVYKEVYLSDFAMLEALKQFHTRGYELIKRNRYLLTGEEFVSSYFILDSQDREENQNKRLEEFIREVLIDLKPNRLYLIEKILNKLIVLNEKTNKFGVDKKRLCTSRHFDNYFLYDIHENLVWDEDIEELYYKLPNINDDDLLLMIEKIIYESGYKELSYTIIQALNNYEAKHLQIDYIDKVCFALSRLKKNKDRRYLIESLGSDTESDIVYILSHYMGILKNLRKDVDNKDTIKILERILKHEEIHLFHIFLIAKFKHDNHFNEEHKQLLDQIVYDFTMRYKEQNGLSNIFDLSMMSMSALLSSWKAINENEYREEVDEYMLNDSFDLFSFISRTVKFDTLEKENNNSFDQFCSLFDVKKLYSKLEDELVFLDSSADRRTINYFKNRYEQLYSHY